MNMQKAQYKKNITFLEEYGFSEDKSIGGWINYRDLKIFQREALCSMEEEDLNKRLCYINKTGKWVVYLNNDVLFLTNNDIEFMFGTDKISTQR